MSAGRRLWTRFGGEMVAAGVARGHVLWKGGRRAITG